MKKVTLCFTIAAISLTSCKKGSTSGTGLCTINDIGFTTELETGESNVTAAVHYSGTDIISIVPPPFKFEYLYAGGKVVFRKDYYGGIQLYADSIYYDGSGNISLIKGFRGSVRVDSNIYEYSSGMVSKIHYYHQDSARRGPLYHAFDNYTYNSAGLLTNVERYNSDGDIYEYYSYTYGTTPNNLFKDNKLVHIYFGWGFGGIGEVFYDGFLKNKFLPETIVFTDRTGTTSYKLTYDFNVYGYPTTVRANGVVVISFSYNC
jgi:hypothetical protein